MKAVDRSSLTDREQAAVEFAELLISAPKSITDARFNGLKDFFSEGQIVELCFFILYCNMYQCYGSGFDTKPPDGDRIVVTGRGRRREPQTA